MTKVFRKSELKKAINGSGGYMSQIARQLNCDWHTAKKYIDQDEELVRLVHDEDEKLNDLTEMKLIDNIKGGDTTAIIFRLKTKAKARGYIETRELKVETPIFKGLDLDNEEK